MILPSIIYPGIKFIFLLIAAVSKAQAGLLTLIHNVFFVQPDKKAYKNLIIPQRYCPPGNIRQTIIFSNCAFRA